MASGLRWLNGAVVVDAGGFALPIQKGDTITLLGPINGTTTAGQDLEWSIDQDGVLTIDVLQSQVDQADHAQWAFHDLTQLDRTKVHRTICGRNGFFLCGSLVF